MNALRELRRDVGLKQKEFASMLQVPRETLRTWDSVRRAVPGHILANARRVIAEYPRNAELLSLDVFALELVFTNDLLHELAVSWSRCHRVWRSVGRSDWPLESLS